jgi:hypothetical protein
VSRALGKVDVSAGVDWACKLCRCGHAAGVPCPPVGVWLVLTLCNACNAATDYYCADHRSGRGWMVKR